MSVVHEGGVPYVRAKIDHFSQGCLAKNILLDDAVLTERASRFCRPYKKQVEFVNANRKTLTFLVLPTSWSHGAMTNLAVRVGVEGVAAVTASVRRQVEQAILTAATAPQVLQIPPRGAEGDPIGGERCPSDTCDLTANGGDEARVVMQTVESGTTVSVWFSRNLKQKTRLMVLPGQFSVAMIDSRLLLPQHAGDLVSTALLASISEPTSGQNAPISTISSAGELVSANTENEK